MNSAVTRILFVALLAAALTVTTGDRAAIGQTEDNTPTQVRVLWLDDPTETATISWSTPKEGASHEVFLDEARNEGELEDYAISVESALDGRYVEEGPFYHHARIEGLEASTTYHFVVASDGVVSREFYFTTAPDDGRRFKLLYGGDSRTGRTERQAMNRLLRSLFDTDDEIIGLVHGGDYIEWANTWWQWTAWLDDHQLTYAADGRILPIVPAKGNHEGRGKVYNRVFGFPGGDAEDNYFDLEFGDRLKLINLDTEVSMAGDQKVWLEERLEEGDAFDWVVANYHRPAFPAFKSPSGAREHWVPLFEEYNVDLVCESDGHTLKRTPPIREEEIDFTGVTYVGEGGLGVRQRTPRTSRWYLQEPGMADSAHHVQVLTIDDGLLSYEAVLRDGQYADARTIQPREDRLAGRITVHSANATSPNHVRIQFTKPVDFESVDPEDFSVEGGPESIFVHPGDVVSSMLRVANEASFEELDDDASLDRRAAENIVEWRSGPDGEDGTSDDREFTSYVQIDDIPWMGPAGLGELAAYASQTTDPDPTTVTLEVDEMEGGTLYGLTMDELDGEDGMTIVSGTRVMFRYGDRDIPADTLGSSDPDVGEPTAGCSTTPSGASDSVWVVLMAIGFVGLRRRRR